MSLPLLASGEPTVTVEELKAVARANNFAIETGSSNEETFLQFANTFDAICKQVSEFPEYNDPRLSAIPVKGTERSYHRPEASENPLNAWMHKASLVASSATSAKGLLAGRRVVLKDNIALAGFPHGLGANASIFKDGKHPISPVDATVARRLLLAGAEVKGTATCENLSLFPMSFTSDAGNVHNAWLPGYATGGSSSGCAALISISSVEKAQKAGQIESWPLGEGVEMGIGGDQGGSIRLPAAYSGIYGLKPTHGLVPYTGIAGLNPMIDHVGPMAQNIDDCALLLQAIAGYDGLDFRMTPESPMSDRVPDYPGLLKKWIDEKQSKDEWTASAAAKGLRIGVLKEAFEMPNIAPEVLEKVRSAVDRFKSLGAEVKEISIPFHKEGGALWTTAARPMLPHFISNKAPDLLGFTMPHLDLLPVDQNYFDVIANRNPATVNALMNASHMESKYGPGLARKAMMHVHELRAAYDKALQEVDVLITPCNATVGPKFPESSVFTADNPTGISKQALDVMRPAVAGTLNTAPFNLTGHPGMSIPVGWGKVKESDAQLPIGMQIVGRRFDELTVFKVAKAWEVGGHGLAR